MDQKQRLALFISALEQAPAAHDRASARAMLAQKMNATEDAHSGVIYDPENWMTYDRMYPPQDDFKQDGSYPGAELFHTQGHRVWFGDSGSIRIEIRKGPGRGQIELDKPGADGTFCPKFD